MNFYKIFIFIHTVFTICGVCSCTEGNFLENVLLNLRENHSDNDFDPFPIKKIFEWDLPLLKLHLSLDTSLSGFMNYEIHQAKVTPDLKLSLNATLGDVTFDGSYNMNGTYYKIIPVNGNGNIYIRLKKFTIYSDMQVAPNNGSIKVLYFDMDYNFNSFEVSVSGLTGESDVGQVIENFVKDLVPITLNKKREQIISDVKKLTMTKGNDYLKHATLKTFIEIIKAVFIY